ncbi:MAG: NusG domain II-containing protein [Clostridia bacterium]|nr:NusG domain II-containing protein [Clostridia bacterium]
MIKQIDHIKKDKGFRVWDLVVYAVIAVIIVAIFCAVFFTRDTSSLEGVEIYLRNELVFDISFEDSSYNVYSDAVSVEEETSSSITLRIASGSAYNVVEIDLSGPSVSVTEANCRSRDCVYTSAITDNNGIIYCSPHSLKIIPADYTANDNGNITIG